MDRHSSNDLYARRHADLCHLYFTSPQPEPLRRIAGHGRKGLFQNFLYRPGQQDVLSETNHCGNIYNSNHDGYGPGNDAEKYFGKNTEGLAEEYGSAGIY